MKRNSLVCAALVTLSLAAAPFAARAGDDGLYEAPVDPNSAFIRVLAPGATLAVVNGTTVDSIEQGLSAYVNVEPGEIPVTAGEASGTVTATPGAYYTLAWNEAGEPVLLQDQAADDPSKAIVYFYNFSDKPTVDLFAPSAKVNAVEAVPASGGKSVALKAPLQLDFEVQAEGETIAKVASVDLKRRGGVSIVFSGADGNYTASAVQNAFFRAE